MEIRFKPSFLRQLKKLPLPLQEEAIEKVDLFRKSPRQASLKVHALHGRLKGSYSFSVNYRYRVIFEWEVQGKIAVLLDIGDHSIYD